MANSTGLGGVLGGAIAETSCAPTSGSAAVQYQLHALPLMAWAAARRDRTRACSRCGWPCGHIMTVACVPSKRIVGVCVRQPIRQTQKCQLPGSVELLRTHAIALTCPAPATSGTEPSSKLQAA